jgi:soluble lytic murein transglycosylase-like protein
MLPMILAAAALMFSFSSHAAIDASALRSAAMVGDCGTVTALLEAEEPASLDAAQLLLGARCAARTGAKEQAVSYATAASQRGGLGGYPALVQVEILMATASPELLPTPDDAAAAEAALAGLGPVSSLSPELRLLRDKALIAQGRGLEARDDLRTLLDGEHGPEARYWLAFAAEQRGDIQPALTTYLACWIRNAASPWSERAAARMAVLGKPMPDLSSGEGRSQAMQRVQVLMDANHAGEALDLLRQLEAAGGTPPDARIMAEACFDGRDYPCAVAAYVRLGSPAAVGAETLYKHALATYRDGDYPGAVNLYTALFQRYPDHGKGDTASYKIGYSALDQGLLDVTISELEAHLQRYPSSKHADEALWFIGWCHWKQGDSDAAVKAWSQLVSAHPNSSLASGAAYWKARAAGGASETKALTSLAQRWPEDGRAWFALEHIGQLEAVAAVPSPALPPLPEAFTATHPEATVADALLEVGLYDLASQALDPVARAASGADSATRLAVGRRLVEVGELQRGRKLAGVSCGGSASDPQVREICMPRPHADVVNGVLEGSTLDPYLPYAIMTAESALQPGVTSWAGARGLMQVMPDLGATLHAQRYPDRPYDPSLLYQGAYNASLGTAELRRLHEHFAAQGHGQTLPFVIAGYNGGQEAVERWLSEVEGDLELDAWAEDIAYGETRRYVRRVLGYLMAYHLAYGG